MYVTRQFVSRLVTFCVEFPRIDPFTGNVFRIRIATELEQASIDVDTDVFIRILFFYRAVGSLIDDFRHL